MNYNYGLDLDVDMDRIIEDLHYILSRLNNQKIDSYDIERADEEIKEYIKKCFEKRDFIPVKRENGCILLSDSEMAPIVLHYYAHLQDNILLLDRLNSEGYFFTSGGYTYALFALARELSSKFEEDEFINLLINRKHVVGRFYNSLMHTEGEEREAYLQEFANIMHINPHVVDVLDNKGRVLELDNLISKRTLSIFGSEFLLGATESQKKVIASLVFHLSDDDIIKIKDYLNKYPNRVPIIDINRKVLSVLTVDELASIDEKTVGMYRTAIKEGLIERLRNLLILDPLFTCPDNFIKTEIFKVLDDDTILGLTNLGKIEISEMKIPQSSSAVIYPVMKIHRAVFRDNKRKRKLEKGKGTNSITRR